MKSRHGEPGAFGWLSGPSVTAARWDGLTDQVAYLPGVIERLLTDHRPDAESRCVACTTPGRGTPAAEWPCSLYTLALTAHAKRTNLLTHGLPHLADSATPNSGEDQP